MTPRTARLTPVSRVVRSVLARVDREEQARRALTRVREARAAFHAEWRRILRDDHATHVLVAALLGPESNFIDVGAHAGEVLEIACRVAPHGHHIAYEPLPEFHGRLVARFPGCDVRQAALADATGSAAFTYVVDRPAVSGLRARADLAGGGPTRRIEVRTERLDDVLPEGYVPRLLKIDVEGAELQVLRGAEETLRRHRPFVLLEHGLAAASYGTRAEDVFDILAGAGLRLFDLDGEGPFTRDGFAAAAGAQLWNFLGVPA